MGSAAFSRRDFVRTAAAGGTAAAAGSLLAAGSSAQAAENPAGSEALRAPASDPGIEVIDCDVLVIGAGLNGTYAANQITAEGGSVTIVEKGPWRHTGVAGASLDLFNITGARKHFNSMSNTELLARAIEGHGFKDEPVWTYKVNHGEVIPTRNEDGSPEGYGGSTGLSQGYFFRKEMDRLEGLDSVTVYDHTMITNYLVNDGVCRGAIGLHLPSGRVRLFRANATLATTGGCTWIYGWRTVSAHTAGYIENTADADMAAWRLGCGIGEAEFAGFDMIGINPSGIAFAAANIDAEPTDASAVRDKDGNVVFADDLEQAADRNYFNQKIARLIYEEGRGTENMGVMFRVGEVEFTRRQYERNLPLLRRFGIDTDTYEMEALPDMYDHGGQPVVDNEMMTEVEGLFCGRGAGCTGIMGGDVNTNMVFGRYAGHCALAYARNAEKPAEVDMAPVLAEYDRLHAVRTFTCDDPVTPFEVRRAIQAAGERGLGLYRTAEMMEDALAQLDAVRRDLLPRMVVSDPSCAYNMDWKQAVEAYNMLDCCEISVRASLAREESRGNYLRGDFPEVDDENWNCMLLCYRRDDGTVELVKRDIPRAEIA